jgi:hypothetical protein
MASGLGRTGRERSKKQTFLSVAEWCLFLQRQLGTHLAEVPAILNHQHTLLITLWRTSSKLLSVKDFFMPSNPISDQKYIRDHFKLFQRFPIVF